MSYRLFMWVVAFQLIQKWFQCRPTFWNAEIGFFSSSQIPFCALLQLFPKRSPFYPFCHEFFCIFPISSSQTISSWSLHDAIFAINISTKRAKTVFAHVSTFYKELVSIFYANDSTILAELRRIHTFGAHCAPFTHHQFMKKQ